MMFRPSRTLQMLTFPTLFLIASCSSSTAGDLGGSTPSRGSAERTSATFAAAACTGASSASIRIALGNSSVRGNLNSSPAADALRERLPLTVELRDYNSVEKTGAITPLPMDDMPEGAAAASGTIGYYAPDRVLVLYYRDVSYFPGIAILGEFDNSAGTFGADTPDLIATVESDCVGTS